MWHEQDMKISLAMTMTFYLVLSYPSHMEGGQNMKGVNKALELHSLFRPAHPMMGAVIAWLILSPSKETYPHPMEAVNA